MIWARLGLAFAVGGRGLETRAKGCLTVRGRLSQGLLEKDCWGQVKGCFEAKLRVSLRLKSSAFRVAAKVGFRVALRSRLELP